MDLPDADRLSPAFAGAERLLGERLLASGLTTAYVRAVEGDAAALSEPTRSRLTRLLVQASYPQGDVEEALDGRRFDLVVSQPRSTPARRASSRSGSSTAARAGTSSR